MPVPDRSHALEHVVVVLFENRSFACRLTSGFDRADVGLLFWLCGCAGFRGGWVVLLAYDRFPCSPMSASNACACCGSGDRPRSRSPVRWGSGPPRRTAWSARRPSLAQAESPGPALAGCWISPSWSTGLTVGDHPGWPLHEDPAAGTDGLAAVLVARRHRHGKVSVCGYLADVYCLGVKNALGPEVMDDLGLRGFVRDFFSGYDGDPLEVPIELAREVVFGSVEYARSLGFDPHPDFAAARGASRFVDRPERHHLR